MSAKASSAANAQIKGGRWVSVSAGKKYRYKNGTYAKSTWLTINGKRYYFLNTGLMAKNRLITTGGKTYYVRSNGLCAKSAWVTTGGKTYYFGSNGVRVQNSWVKRKGTNYYVGPDGTILTNQWVDHGQYYVKANGTRARNCVKDGYYLNGDGKKVVKVFKGDYIFVGDSRTVGMQEAIHPSDTLYIAKKGQGYSWLKSTGGVKLQYYLKANPDVKVVLALGVNDLGNINSYIAYYKKLIKNYPKTKFYVLSVNPVDKMKIAKRGLTSRYKTIASFNKKMQKTFSSRYIDTYKKMIADGFRTKDGLHYTSDENRKLYQTIIAKIR